MPRNRRHIESGCVYEIVIRAKEGIPFGCTPYMNFLIRSCLARTQRDKKVHLCHFVCVGNHFHIIVVAKDKENMAKFHMELKRKLTEVVKRVLDLDELLLWESSRTSVMRILDLTKLIQRIIYLYNNPTQANLCSSIKQYKGVSSWKLFSDAAPNLTAVQSIKVPYVPLSKIPSLDAFNRYSKKYLQALKEFATHEETLTLEPFCCFDAFSQVEYEDIAAIKRGITARVLEVEKNCIQRRAEEGIQIRSQFDIVKEHPTVTGWKPKKSGPKIYFLGTDAETRVWYWNIFKAFCDHCKELYRSWKLGEIGLKEWPKEAYIPGIPDVPITGD